jgi:hypothetical protein
LKAKVVVGSGGQWWWVVGDGDEKVVEMKLVMETKMVMSWSKKQTTGQHFTNFCLGEKNQKLHQILS